MTERTSSSKSTSAAEARSVADVTQTHAAQSESDAPKAPQRARTTTAKTRSKTRTKRSTAAKPASAAESASSMQPAAPAEPATDQGTVSKPRRKRATTAQKSPATAGEQSASSTKASTTRRKTPAKASSGVGNQKKKKAQAATPAAKPAEFSLIGRIPVTEVFPVIEDGRWPSKAVVGEVFPIRATVFREGHDRFGATAVLVRPDGSDGPSARMVDIAPGLDRYEARLAADAPGDWGLRVEGWSDPYGTWRHDADIKVPAGIDVELMLEEGARILTRAAQVPGRRDVDAATLTGAAAHMRDASLTALQRLGAGTCPEVIDTLDRLPLRDHVSPSATYPLQVDRPRALTGSWYEIFPRSLGAHVDEDGQWTSGTLRSATARLDRIAAMGFDVLYLTPISPIGLTNRKGRNNTLTARPGDPGSPYGIGSADGGHDAIHPDLGTFEDFDALVARAGELGMEVALDLALQCSPDHPWVTEHPEWFTVLADGSIAYAENPPKKYQDIYPLNFDNDPEGIYAAIRDVVYTWINHGVTIFRVDNPHTKPLNFWQRLLREVHSTHPNVLFLAEAFTRPAMMRTLGMIGFHQSYTYFAWRNTKEELIEYLVELSQDTAHMLRPAFWPTTHDILTPFMTNGKVPAFKLRAVLAATLSPTWGIYSGYELAESVPRPGYEEQIDNEKYELKPRDFGAARVTGIEDLLTKLNATRRAHPALQQLRDIWFHGTSNDQIIAYSKRVDAAHCPTGRDDVVLTVVNLDPHHPQDGEVYLTLDQLGVRSDADPSRPVIRVTDELTGASYDWSGHNYVRLDPFAGQSAHVFSVEVL